MARARTLLEGRVAETATVMRELAECYRLRGHQRNLDLRDETRATFRELAGAYDMIAAQVLRALAVEGRERRAEETRQLGKTLAEIAASEHGLIARFAVDREELLMWLARRAEAAAPEAAT